MKRFVHIFFLFFLFSVTGIAQIPTLGLVGYWPFDGNANDYSGFGNHGTISGATPALDRFSLPAHAYAFDGINDKIVVPHDAAIDMSDTSDFTICVWANISANNMNSVLLAKHHTGYWNGYCFLGNNQQDPGYCTAPDHVSFYTASGAYQDACSDNPISQDSTKWVFITGVHIAATNSIHLYINTVQQLDAGQSSGTISNIENLTFGGIDQCNCAFYSGGLDDIRIYRRVLTQAEINQLYMESPTAVNAIAPVKPALTVLPNPGNGNFTLDYQTAVSGKTEISVYDPSGKIVHTEIKQAVAGTNRYPLQLEQLAAGIYFVRVSGNGGVATERIIRLN